MDWREVRPPDSDARAMFPCKPAGQSREVTLAGATVSMSLFACTGAGTTFALAFADMRDPTLVTPALEELTRAARTHLAAATGVASQPVSVPGMTPNPRASKWHLRGQLPDGRSVQEHGAVFVHGTRVYQATVLGAKFDDEALEAFFGALRVGR